MNTVWILLNVNHEKALNDLKRAGVQIRFEQDDFHLFQCNFLHSQVGLFQVYYPLLEIKVIVSDFRIKKNPTN